MMVVGVSIVLEVVLRIVDSNVLKKRICIYMLLCFSIIKGRIICVLFIICSFG